MKYFSLSFTATKEDYDGYYRDFGKALLLNQFKRTAFMLIFLLVMTVMSLSSRSADLIATVSCIALVTIIMPIFYSKRLAVFSLGSRSNKRGSRYDFYADHIEIHTVDEQNREVLEKHLKMNGFVSVAEGKSNFYFSYMNEKMLLIPKRVLDEEKYGMIKNLIENYFSETYMSI